MPMLLSVANSRRRRMMELVSVLNTLATAMAAVMAMKQAMKSWTVSAMSRVVRTFSALLDRWVRYHALPLRSLAMMEVISVAASRAFSAAKER